MPAPKRTSKSNRPRDEHRRHQYITPMKNLPTCVRVSSDDRTQVSSLTMPSSIQKSETKCKARSRPTRSLPQPSTQATNPSPKAAAQPNYVVAIIAGPKVMMFDPPTGPSYKESPRRTSVSARENQQHDCATTRTSTRRGRDRKPRDQKVKK